MEGIEVTVLIFPPYLVSESSYRDVSLRNMRNMVSLETFLIQVHFSALLC